MDKFTKEQQVQAVYDLKAGYTLGHADIAMLKSMARQLLASMEQEPVAWLLSGGGAKNDVRFDSINAYADPLREVIPLYAAPQLPQPAVPDESEIFDAAIDICRKSDSIDEHAWNHGVLAVMSAFRHCRAAMIQAGNHTEQHLDMVDHSGDANEKGNSPVIPDGWVACSERLPDETNDPDGGATCYLVLYAEGRQPNGGSNVQVSNVTYLRRWHEG